MKSLLLVLLFCVCASPAEAQSGDHIDLVRQIKSQVVAAGINPDLPGDECRRFQITVRVAWALWGEGAGLIAKNPGQNQCNGFGVDAIIYPNGTCIDILGAGNEGPNTPHWIEVPSSASLYRPAFDPGPLPGNGGGDPPLDPPVDPPASDLSARVAALEAHLLYVEKLLRDFVDLTTANFDVVSEAINGAIHRVEFLEARPVYTRCKAVINFLVTKVPISCNLEPS